MVTKIVGNDNIRKMLKVIIDGQVVLSTDMNNLRQEVYGLKKETRDGFEKVTKRIDKIGLQIANLEDDTPTRDEFESLESKVKRLIA